MKLSFEFEGNKIAYDLTYKKRTSISINVEENGQINVLAPVGTPLFTVADKVKGHGAWITGELRRLQKQKENVNQFMYLGKTYGIDVVEDETKETTTVKLVRGKFVVEGSNVDSAHISEALLKWYMAKTTTKLKERAKHFAEHFENMPKKFDVKITKDQLWHIQDNVITFDVNCGVGPLYILDCVLVESLCSYNGIHDSSETLQRLVPDAEIARVWVKQNHDRFIFR